MYFLFQSPAELTMAEMGWSSPQERDRARLRAMDLFCRLDANHDGSVDLRDLETALREWRLHNPSHANVRRVTRLYGCG